MYILLLTILGLINITTIFMLPRFGSSEQEHLLLKAKC